MCSQEQDLAKAREIVKKLRPIDDTLFRKMFNENIALTQFVLRIFLDKPDLIVENVKTQFDLKKLMGARSLILDAYATDSEGKRYNIEAEKSENRAEPHRARYHLSALDVESSKTCTDFDQLPTTYIIFITENDIFKANEPIYPIERVNLKTGKPFDDGEHIMGSAVITPGFKTKAKFIIHAVGPVWHGGNNNEAELLFGAYYNSLKLAKENECISIAFPLISSGIFGYPIDKAWEVALNACHRFIEDNVNYNIDISFAVIDYKIIKIGCDILDEILSRNKITTKSDWKTYDMPEQHGIFILERSFNEKQMSALRKGNIPKEMEDKWFWYMEGNTLYAHRSWTGFCIYKIEFSDNKYHKVTVNRDPNQYDNDDLEDDKIKLNSLLNWWSEEKYDHYNEWLFETAQALENKSKKDYLKIGDRTVEAVFFHNADEPNGYLSNWYLSDFEIDGIKFTSIEQYIMYSKCKLFGDDSSSQKVLETNDTKIQKEIGRAAKGYVDVIWSGMRQIIAYKGLYSKFSQNEELKQMLLSTGDSFLVECAFKDRIWACGLTLDDNDRFDISKWKGENILGFALMQVREALSQDLNL